MENNFVGFAVDLVEDTAEDFENLIEVREENGELLVSGRDLHKALEIGTPYKKWFDRMVAYGFSENIDFLVMDTFVHNSKGGKQSKTDHILKLDMAKELCMIQRSPIGKKFRQYFIEVEKRYRNQVPQISEKEKLQLQLFSGDDFLIAQAHKQLVELEKQPLLETIEEQEEVIEYQKPKVDFHDTINNTDDTISIGEFATLLSNDLNIIVGQNQLFEWFRENGYVKKKSKKDYNMPMGRYVKSGHLKLKEIVIQGTIYLQTRITGKGETYFTDKIIEQGAFGVRKVVDKQN